VAQVELGGAAIDEELTVDPLEVCLAVWELGLDLAVPPSLGLCVGLGFVTTWKLLCLRVRVAACWKLLFAFSLPCQHLRIHRLSGSLSVHFHIAFVFVPWGSRGGLSVSMRLQLFLVVTPHLVLRLEELRELGQLGLRLLPLLRFRRELLPLLD